MDVGPAGSEHFDKQTTASFDFFRSAMHKDSCFVYTSEFLDTSGDDYDWVGEYLTKSVNLVFEYPPYKT